ncbi:MAG: glycosyltransferase family 39 protein, partial [Alphaproteobacteria bacterium]
SDHPLVLRLPFIVTFAGTTWLMFRLGARLFGAWAGAWAALALNLAPVLTISAGGWIVPDGPLMFFLLASALCLNEALFGGGGKARPYLWWSLAGIFLGLAFLSKYHAALFGLGVLAYLIVTPGRRRLLVHPAPWLGAALALAVFAPALVWNAGNDWVSFLFQGGRGSPGGGLRPDRVLTSILGQAAWLLPWIWVPLVWRLYRGLRDGPAASAEAEKTWLLCWLALPAIAIFTLIPLWGGRGLPHWQMPGYLLLFPLLGAWFEDWRGRAPVRARRAVRGAVGAMLVIAALLGSHTATGWGRVVAPSLLRKGDPSLEALDWRDLRTALAARGLLDAPGLFAVSVHWIEAGKIGAAIGDRLPLLCLSGDPRNFAFQHDPAEFAGRDAIIVGGWKSRAEAVRALAPYFAEILPLAPVALTRGGRREMEVAVYRGRGFTGAYPHPFPKRP